MVALEAKLYTDLYLSLNFTQTQNVEKKKEILDLFSTNFLMLPETWIVRLLLENDLSYEATKALLKRALFDFYSEDVLRSIPLSFRRRFEREEMPFNKMMNSRPYKYVLSKCLLVDENLISILIDALSFPHPYLTNIYMLYKEFGGSLPTNEIKQLYTKNNEFYKKIVTAKTTIQWFEFVTESDNNQFIIQNVEARIAQDPMNIALWKIYINFLKARDKNMASQVYYRYRRIFLEDIICDLKAVFNYDMCNRYFFVEQQYFNYFVNKKISQEFFKSLNYNDPICQQSIPFRWTFFNYVIRNASESHIKKLNKACKVLFFQFGNLICHRLCISDSVKPKYFQESLILNENFYGLKNLNNLWVSYSLHVQHPSKVNLLSAFIPKIQICTVRFLRISNQNFSLTEYEFLTQSKKIRKVILTSIIVKDNNEIISFADAFKNLIFAFHIEFNFKFRITSDTFDKLMYFGKIAKTYFIKMLISNYALSFNYMQLLYYLNAISREDAENWITFDKELTLENKHYFLTSLNSAIQNFKEFYGTMPKIYHESDV